MNIYSTKNGRSKLIKCISGRFKSVNIRPLSMNVSVPFLRPSYFRFWDRPLSHIAHFMRFGPTIVIRPLKYTTIHFQSFEPSSWTSMDRLLWLKTVHFWFDPWDPRLDIFSSVSHMEIWPIFDGFKRRALLWFSSISLKLIWDNLVSLGSTSSVSCLLNKFLPVKHAHVDSCFTVATLKTVALRTTSPSFN